jgi:hypothetical protein
MIYTVTWLPSAQNELASLWVMSANRMAIRNAADAMDIELRIDPDMKGFAFFGNRILRIDPLLVVFSVKPDDRLVEVLQVFLMTP